jgi:hypothetical protein
MLGGGKRTCVLLSGCDSVILRVNLGGSSSRLASRGKLRVASTPVPPTSAESHSANGRDSLSGSGGVVVEVCSMAVSCSRFRKWLGYVRMGVDETLLCNRKGLAMSDDRAGGLPCCRKHPSIKPDPLVSTVPSAHPCSVVGSRCKCDLGSVLLVSTFSSSARVTGAVPGFKLLNSRPPSVELGLMPCQPSRIVLSECVADESRPS